MNPLVLLPLLAAACMAAPAAQVFAPTLAGFPGAFPQAHFLGAPAVATVQVPLTKTVHFETKPVVTGFSTSIIKPAIATGFAAAPVVAPAQLVVSGRQFPGFPPIPTFPPSGNGTADAPAFPEFPMIPGVPAPSPNGTETPAFPAFPTIPGFPSPNATAPGADAPQFPAFPPIEFPQFPTPAPPASNNTFEFLNTNAVQFQQTVEQPLNNFFPHVFSPVQFTNNQIFSVAPQPAIVEAQPAPAPIEDPSNDAVVVEARSAQPTVISAPAPAPVAFAPAPIAVAQPQVVALRAAQAGDFGPLVTKEKVLAPVRTHTEITPQVTQIQPEVTVRKVIHDVPVAQPIAVHTPVQFAVNSPVVQGPLGFSNVVGQPIFNGQQPHFVL